MDTRIIYLSVFSFYSPFNFYLFSCVCVHYYFHLGSYLTTNINLCVHWKDCLILWTFSLTLRQIQFVISFLTLLKIDGPSCISTRFRFLSTHVIQCLYRDKTTGWDLLFWSHSHHRERFMVSCFVKSKRYTKSYSNMI